MKLARRNNAIERLQSRQRQHDGSKAKDGTTRPGSMNVKKGSGLKARHS